ncbi:MAG: DUF2878 domain-containing protein [Gammaproteobacteria bacterium HGW-Gammaproteobacteria-8]|nr:MAG: DUF2878 domain-containing protein [Gammaproteobacteria bacterium HGW-Gammaproteobacteria-8]
MSRYSNWINFAWMQASWWACILGAAHGRLWPGLLVVSAFALWQLNPARRHSEDVATLLRFVFAGLLLDSLWPLLGVVEYAHPGPVPGLTPAWLMLLWVALALTVHHSMAMFKQRWQAFVLLATVGSPMSYAAAAKLGAVAWTAPAWVVVLCVGPVWALIVGLLLRQAGRGRVAAGARAAEEFGG